jgi:hypothetical protein
MQSKCETEHSVHDECVCGGDIDHRKEWRTMNTEKGIYYSGRGRWNYDTEGTQEVSAMLA